MTVRVGFLGAGFIATFHSKMLAASGVTHERAGVFDPDPERAAGFVARAGGHVAAGEDEVLDGCDAVYVCTWTSEHPRLVAAAAERGLAIFCEKPLGVDLATAEAMTRAVVDAGVIHQVGLVLRYSPAFDLLEALVADRDRVGRVMTVTFRDDQHLPTGGRYRSSWRGDPALAGSGVLLEHSIHDLDLMDRLVGPIGCLRADSRSFHGIVGIEDLFVVTAELADGGVGTLTTVWHDVMERPGNRYLEVHCERAWFSVTDDWFGPVRWAYDGGDSGGTEGSDLLARLDAVGRPARNPDGEFVQAVIDGRPAMPGFDVALRAHRLADAAYRAAAEGRPVSPTAD